MRKTHILGLLLWRGGQMLAGGAAAYYGVKYALRWMRVFGLETPRGVEVGVVLLVAGFLLVMLSLILERARDARREREEEAL